MTKRDLAERMTMNELSDWIEYFRVIDEAGKKEPEPPSLAEMDPQQIAAAFGA